MPSDQDAFETDLYGRILNGDESDLDLARLARANYLKNKMRTGLEVTIGDSLDNIADVTKALTLASAIVFGLIDDLVVKEVQAYTQRMLAAYGGPEAILPALRRVCDGIVQHVAMKYNGAKAAIAVAATIDEVNAIDIDQ